MLLTSDQATRSFPAALGRLPSKDTLYSKAGYTDEQEHYLLSFKHYRDDLCEIDFLEKNRPKECIRVFRRLSHARIGNLREQNIDQIPVRNSGDYKKLFNRLENGVDLFEHKIQGTARIFYFTKKTHFYVVAITNNHYETDKHR